MDYTHPQYWPQLKELARTIDTLDYFQILNLPQTSTTNDIRNMYYQMSRALHPDKFFHLPDEELKNSIGKIFRRVTEAYTILRDEPKRVIYLKDINGPQRATKLRFDEGSEQEQKQAQREAVEVAKTPQGKKMYQAALLDMQQGRFDKALKNLQSALLFESGNEALKKLKEEVAAKIPK